MLKNKLSKRLGAVLMVAILMSSALGIVPAFATDCPTIPDPNAACCKPGANSTDIYVSIAVNDANGKPTHCVPNTGGSDLKTNPIFIWAINILKFLSFGVGVAVTGGIVYGAILYTTAAGNASQTKKAVSVMISSVSAIVLYALMFAIINFIVPGGILT